LAFLICDGIRISEIGSIVVRGGLNFDQIAVVCGVLEVRVGLQCHVCFVGISKSEFHGSQSLPIETAYGREARIKPVGSVNRICAVVVRPTGIFLALPVFAGISLQVVDQFGVSCYIKGQELGGRIKVDLNGVFDAGSTHKLFAIIKDEINIEVPAGNRLISIFESISNVGGVVCWVPAKFDL